MAGFLVRSFLASGGFQSRRLMEWLKKPAKSRRPGSKEAVLALAGLWKDDPTVDAMMEEIDRLRGERPTEDEP